MKNYIEHHPWKIIERQYDPAVNRISESLFSTGNGSFGLRGNVEEVFSGPSLQGHYVAGVYYPDKTRVGWWKNGYPEYFAKVLNAPSWIGVSVQLNGQELDMGSVEVLDFYRELDMKEGILKRRVHCRLPDGLEVVLASERYCSVADPDLGVLSYEITAVNRDADLELKSFVDGRIRNSDANYNEKFWKAQFAQQEGDRSILVCSTKKTGFFVGTGAVHQASSGAFSKFREKKKLVGAGIKVHLRSGEPWSMTKRALILSSMNHPSDALHVLLAERLERIREVDRESLRQAHIGVWADKWKESDIEIVGDVAAQQAIRFNIFQLHCTYSGADERLNIGPKGFTGEKYGGSTYWDTEAYCLPFYLSTADEQVARNLLLYRYRHLPKAIENARLLGFNKGAALYPMVTMNGEECHNEWEITFEEIHRNGAIAYAIHDYVRYTGDTAYLITHGVDVLVAIARFWSQRANWSKSRNSYVILGVTGPNEFENNVNNNWYTNWIARWCLQYTRAVLDGFTEEQRHEVIGRLDVQTEELYLWTQVANNMYLPSDPDSGLYLQQDGFLDKEIVPASQIPADQLPIVEHWSWDRILRSCYIKQADVLQGMYFFEEAFDRDTIRRHFDFYEPITVHESSLSPCVHSILASSLDDIERAYQFYLRTARLDLDDYNNDTCDGLHITSMAGTWMSITKGFAGMRASTDGLRFKPLLPAAWQAYAFSLRYRGKEYRIRVDANGMTINGEVGNRIPA